MGGEPRVLCIWRHPKAIGAAGRCIGRTDLCLDPRKAKRLAHRIRCHARRLALPREVVTSPLQRSADVGRWLARWGWQHRIDTALAEIDFGAWDGLTWDEIGESAVSAWCADIARHADHGGESVAMLFERCAFWLSSVSGSSTRCVVGHAGWINAARLLKDDRGLPETARAWPPPLVHGKLLQLHGPADPMGAQASEGSR